MTLEDWVEREGLGGLMREFEIHSAEAEPEDFARLAMISLRQEAERRGWSKPEGAPVGPTLCMVRDYLGPGKWRSECGRQVGATECVAFSHHVTCLACNIAMAVEKRRLEEGGHAVP